MAPPDYKADSGSNEIKYESHPGSSGPDTADKLLEDLGYAPELQRNRSTLQVAFMSFVLASIPYGLATTLYYPLIGGGPVNIIWGWVLVSLIIICVASSLGEITSVYPTAGGTTMLYIPRSGSQSSSLSSLSV
jgi:amino acid permease